MNGFPDNARVCFLGDSITHNNEFVSRISAYYHENLKERNVNFYNCGVSGGGIYTLLQIFDEDIISRKPTHAVIMIGINDSGRDSLAMPRGEERYRLLNEHFENYKKNLDLLTKKLTDNNVEIILCTPHLMMNIRCRTLLHCRVDMPCFPHMPIMCEAMLQAMDISSAIITNIYPKQLSIKP
ncbi:MAG: hypothetical protein IJ460_00130 [Clostridia bacterium]|nr:hypothetical protein [Clostridia bacterium]